MVLTKELVARLFEYRDGILYWKEKPSARVNIEDKVGTIKAKSSKCEGYWATRIKGVNLYNHTIVFFMCHGYVPKTISFKNGNTLDYSIENIVERSRSELIQKGKLRKDNTSGYKGVSYSKRDNNWIAYIGKDNKRYLLGLFDTKEEANVAYLKEEYRLYGKETSNNG